MERVVGAYSVFHVENLAKRYRISKTAFSAFVDGLFNELGLRGREISCVFVSDQRMVHCHKVSFGKNNSTDVISFPWHAQCLDKGNQTLLGDLIVGLDRAWYQAPVYGNPFHGEVALYVIHGVLHLIGYDDTTSAKKHVMFAKQSALFETLQKKKLITKRLVQRSVVSQKKDCA